MERKFTLLDDGRATEVLANVAGETVTLSPSALEAALGWRLEPRGLCRDDVCVPVRDGDDRVSPTGIDLAAFAELVNRPLALDVAEGAAALGTSAAARGEALRSLRAPDFSLPDLRGLTHSLSDFRGKKVLLVAYASW